MSSYRTFTRRACMRIAFFVLSLHVLFDVGLAVSQAEEPRSSTLEARLSKTEIRVGETAQLKVIVRFSDGSTKDVTGARHGTVYEGGSKFSREPIVKVDPDGRVTALSDGKQSRTVEDIFIVNTPYNLATIISVTIVKEDSLYLNATKTTLRVGETVQLTVHQKLLDGSMRDLTDTNMGTTYYTTAESRLIPEPDGRVTCIGTRGKTQESAIIGAQNGKLNGSIEFTLLSPGPGPSLEVGVEKAILLEGEQTQLLVYKPLPTAGRQEVTSTSTGTQYLMFLGLGRHDPSEVKIDNHGLVSAPNSIGHLTRLPVIVFVRNGNNVGWIELTVLPRGGRK